MRIIIYGILAIVIILSLTPNSFTAQYIPDELCMIKWGDATSQLKIVTPFSDYDTSMGPIESLYTDSWTYTDGPTQAIVDKNENIYVFSYGLNQFKGFAKNGNLLFNYSNGESQFWKSEFGYRNISNLYVDSLENIYIIFFPGLWYIGVIDKNEHIVDKLYPMGESANYEIDNFWPGSNDILSVAVHKNSNEVYLKYEKGKFLIGGSADWLAKDGNYYYACYIDTISLRFYKYSNPDSSGIPEVLDTTIISVTSPVFGSDFLGVDDSLYLYVLVGLGSEDRPSVLVYNSKYEQVYQIIPQEYTNKYQWRMGYWLHPNGDVYEFRCLDDGLHVIKWSKR
jgi:hypothetical protein